MKGIRVFGLIFIGLMMTVSAWTQPAMLVDKIIAVVSSDIILLSDVESQFQVYKYEDPSVDANARCDILNDLLLEKLFVAQAKVDSIVVTEDEVESELNRRIEYFIAMLGGEEAMEEYYGKSVVEMKEDFRVDIYKSLLSDRMRGRIFSNVNVTPKEVKQFYNDIPEDSLPFFDAELELSQVVIYPKVNNAQRDKAFEKLNEIRSKIVDGSSGFCTAAIANSDDPGSRKDCGSLGYIRRGEMVPEFEAEAFNLEEGEVSEVFETDFGFHIVECLDIKGEKREVRHILISPDITKDDFDRTAKTLDSIRVLVEMDSLPWERAIQVFSEDELTKGNGGYLQNQATGSNKFTVDQLEGPLVVGLDGIKVGGVTKILNYSDGRVAGFRIVRLMAETEAHVADLSTDYNKIAAAALQMKQQEALMEWIEKKRKETYVSIDDDFKLCESLSVWISDTNQ